LDVKLYRTENILNITDQSKVKVTIDDNLNGNFTSKMIIIYLSCTVQRNSWQLIILIISSFGLCLTRLFFSGNYSSLDQIA